MKPYVKKSIMHVMVPSKELVTLIFYKTAQLLAKTLHTKLNLNEESINLSRLDFAARYRYKEKKNLTDS